MIGSITRTRPLMKAAKGEVGLAMSKWWKKKRPAHAEITMHLAPNELHPILPWIKTFPKKLVDRVPIYLWPIGTLGFVWAVMEWSEAVDYEEDKHHRF